MVMNDRNEHMFAIHDVESVKKYRDGKDSECDT